MIKALIFLTIFCVVILIFLKTLKLGRRITYISLLILSITLIVFFTAFINLNKDISELNYMPPVFDGERIIPGHFNDKN